MNTKHIMDKIPVRPVITGPDWIELGSIVGIANTRKEAFRLVRAAGYRIMHIGGLHTYAPMSDEFWVTVYPKKQK